MINIKINYIYIVHVCKVCGSDKTNVTGVKFLSPSKLISVSIDQRLILWSVDITEGHIQVQVKLGPFMSCIIQLKMRLIFLLISNFSLCYECWCFYFLI